MLASTRNNLFIFLIVLLSASLIISLYLMYENGGSIRRDGWFAPILVSLIWMAAVYYYDAKAGVTFQLRR